MKISRLLRAALQPRLLRLAEELQPGHQAEKEADRIFEPALFRRAGIHSRGAAPPGGAGPSHFELGRQALTDVRIGVANGEPLVRCQLLASEFYEALKRALRAPDLSPVERWAVMAAANEGRRVVPARSSVHGLS
jgi:hypothetical protein